MNVEKAAYGEPPIPQTAIVRKVENKSAGSYIRTDVMQPLIYKYNKVSENGQ